MANASADNLIKRILSEARDTAAHILAEAEKQCNDIRSEQEKRIAQNAESLSKTRAIQVKEILDGAETRARLEGQKEALADKRDLLDKAFASAYEALCNQSSEELSQLFASVLKKEYHRFPEAARGDVPGRAALRVHERLRYGLRLYPGAAEVSITARFVLTSSQRWRKPLPAWCHLFLLTAPKTCCMIQEHTA